MYIEPLHLENIVFNFIEINTFFVVGSKNVEFDQNINSMSNTSGDPPDQAKFLDNQILFEKFFINQGEDLSSQTLGYFSLGKAKKNLRPLNYCISENHEFLALYSSDNQLSCYKVSDLIFKE